MTTDPPDNLSTPSRVGISRRQFLSGAATMGLGLTELRRVGGGVAYGATLPAPETSGIEHVVLVMMENRSFDHYLGWVPNADGVQEGLVYQDSTAKGRKTRALLDPQGCSHPDPDHSYAGGRLEYNEGACDGWLRAGNNDRYAIGYYTASDLDFYRQASERWTVCDRYFPSIMAPTFPNRLYQHAAQTDRITNTQDISTLPTIWDRLAGAGLTGRYYFSDSPFLVLWGGKYRNISRPIAEFYADAAAGTLPQVAFVDPRFFGQANGTSGDDHPHADIRNGQAFLNQVYTALTTGPGWNQTVLVINYDEWGGFFDHVPPPFAVAIPPADQAAGNEDGLLGFRVPCLIASPFARHRVSHIVFDHTSVLRMIEWRWGLQPLTVRDATTNNLAEALRLDRRRLGLPQFDVPVGPFGSPCPTTALTAAASQDADMWVRLREMAAGFGFPV
jgi:phospholipase C